MQMCTWLLVQFKSETILFWENCLIHKRSDHTNQTINEWTGCIVPDSQWMMQVAA